MSLGEIFRSKLVALVKTDLPTTIHRVRLDGAICANKRILKEKEEERKSES